MDVSLAVAPSTGGESEEGEELSARPSPPRSSLQLESGSEEGINQAFFLSFFQYICLTRYVCETFSICFTTTLEPASRSDFILNSLFDLILLFQIINYLIRFWWLVVLFSV